MPSNKFVRKSVNYGVFELLLCKVWLVVFARKEESVSYVVKSAKPYEESQARNQKLMFPKSKFLPACKPESAEEGP